jgi:hypothetical protein
MNYSKLTVLFLILIFITQIIIAQDKVSIALLDLEGNDISKAEARILSDELRAILFQTNKYNVLERNNMESILTEQGFQMSGCVSTECAVEAGKLLGVHKMVAGSIGKLGRLYNISIRMFDVKTSKIEKLVSERHSGSIEQLLDVIKQAGYQLAGVELEKAPETDAQISVDLKPQSIIRAKNKFGIRAGITSATTTRHANGGSGFLAGAVFSFVLVGDLCLQSELLYSTTEFEYFEPAEIISYEKLHLALLLSHDLTPASSGFIFNVKAGPSLNFLLSANKEAYGEVFDLTTYDEGGSAIKGNELALVFSPGIGIRLGKSDIVLEAVYELGLTTIFKDETNWEVGKNRVLSFRAGISF